MEASLKTLTAARSELKTQPLTIPWFIYAALFGSTSIIIGVIWDISWHMSIGRDTFWSPPHLAIYLGGVVAGLSSGWAVLKTTFAGTEAERAASVRIWGLRGPLGAFMCLWGAMAMLTSAPFDDWWHNTYGLDTKILSPPHVVLALGIMVIQVGAMIVVVARQNRSEQQAELTGALNAKRRAWLRAMYVYAAGILLTTVYLMAWEYMGRVFMHSSIFYQVGCVALPVFIIAAARGARLRWPATATTGVYMGLSLAMLWLLPLFPAEPKLGPVRQHVTHLVPLEFPLLLVIPAVAIDLLMRRNGRDRDWRLSALLGLAFFIALLVTQWLFGYFLMSPYARNWVFATDQFAYYVGKNWYVYQHKFYPWDSSTGALLRGLLLAIPLAIASMRVGLWWGSWMRRVQR
jgi:hypothetical protein